jgi:DNA-binding GntR family transcriptional regulator
MLRTDRANEGANAAPNEVPTLVSAVVGHVKEAILHGAYPPGSPLPEVPLARKVGASRATVREALRSLSDLGLVVVHPRKGAVVASMSPPRIREIFTLRAVLEAFAVRLSLTEGRIRADELAAIEAAFEAMRGSVERGDAYDMIEADMRFHWSICSTCGHEILLEQLGALQAQTRQFIFYTKFYDSDIVGEVEAHLPVLTAIRAFASDQAEQAMRNHILSAGERLLVSMVEKAHDKVSDSWQKSIEVAS